ncbi:MAG: hypothetical protein KatS3mg059_1361 [Thermomicrobiales bacterium]|nr:MAG: hypothetical protein KatS3mg059_1361 [Thermomicrobiales bacterium]
MGRDASGLDSLSAHLALTPCPLSQCWERGKLSPPPPLPMLGEGKALTPCPAQRVPRQCWAREEKAAYCRSRRTKRTTPLASRGAIVPALRSQGWLGPAHAPCASSHPIRGTGVRAERERGAHVLPSRGSGYGSAKEACFRRLERWDEEIPHSRTLANRVTGQRQLPRTAVLTGSDERDSSASPRKDGGALVAANDQGRVIPSRARDLASSGANSRAPDAGTGEDGAGVRPGRKRFLAPLGMTGAWLRNGGLLPAQRDGRWRCGSGGDDDSVMPSRVRDLAVSQRKAFGSNVRDSSASPRYDESASRNDSGSFLCHPVRVSAGVRSEGSLFSFTSCLTLRPVPASRSRMRKCAARDRSASAQVSAINHQDARMQRQTDA